VQPIILWINLDPVRLAYQPPASSTFLSEQTGHQQPASSTFLSQQISTSYQPPAKRTCCWSLVPRVITCTGVFTLFAHMHQQNGVVAAPRRGPTARVSPWDDGWLHTRHVGGSDQSISEAQRALERSSDPLKDRVEDARMIGTV
jgi:hypothetical protein